MKYYQRLLQPYGRLGNIPKTILIYKGYMRTLYEKEIEEYLKNGGTVKCEYGEDFLTRRFRTLEERREIALKEATERVSVRN